VNSFIPLLPESEHLIEKHFHGLFSGKEDFWGLRSCFEDEIEFSRTQKFFFDEMTWCI